MLSLDVNILDGFIIDMKTSHKYFGIRPIVLFCDKLENTMLWLLKVNFVIHSLIPAPIFLQKSWDFYTCSL